MDSFQFQEGHEYFLRIFAKNEIGFSDPLENDEPFKVVRPAGKQLKMFPLKYFSSLIYGPL